MTTSRAPLALLLAIFAGSVVHAKDNEPVDLWSNDGVSASIKVGSAKLQSSGLVTTTYTFFAANTGLATPEMFVGTFAAVCQPRDEAPVQVLHFKTQINKFVGGKWTLDNEAKIDPPKELEPTADRQFLELPSKAACKEAWRMVRKQ